MQVVILCGGFGTRIRDVTEDIPKPMIPIGGRPILWHIMKSYARYGFKDFVLCLGYKSGVIKRYFLDYHLAESDISVSLSDAGRVDVHATPLQEDWNITLVETGLHSQTGCRVKRIERYVRSEQFLLTYGDGLADLNVKDLADFHMSHGKIGTVTAVQAPGRFGEIELQGSRVTDFAEKPAVSRGRISGGFFVFNRAIFDRLGDDPSLIFERAPLVQLARDGELRAYKHDGFWHCMDNSRDYKYLNDLWDAQTAPWLASDATQIRAAA